MKNKLILLFFGIVALVANLIVGLLLFFLCDYIDLGELETMIVTFIGGSVFLLLSINAVEKLSDKLTD